MRLTKCEQEMMEVFWAAGKPLSQPELLAQAGEKSWKNSSVYILLNGLLEKEMLREVGFVRSGKAYARTFAPALSYEEYCAMEIRASRQKPDLAKLVCALLREGDISDQTIEELEALLRESRRKLENT